MTLLGWGTFTAAAVTCLLRRHDAADLQRVRQLRKARHLQLGLLQRRQRLQTARQTLAQRFSPFLNASCRAAKHMQTVINR